MLNKCLLLPLMFLKLKTAFAIKSSLGLFALGLGAGYFLKSSHQRQQPNNGTSNDKIEPGRKKMPANRKAKKN